MQFAYRTSTPEPNKRSAVESVLAGRSRFFSRCASRRRGSGVTYGGGLGGRALAAESVEAVATADPPFAAVVAEHWDGVYRLLHSLSGDMHETEDLTQETFLRALAKWQTFRPDTQLRAWLLRVATNAFLDGRRKRKRARSGPLVADPPAKVSAPGHALETAER